MHRARAWGRRAGGPSCCGAIARMSSASSRAPRWRSPRRSRPAEAAGAGSSTRCAPSRGPKPTQRPMPSSAIGPTWSLWRWTALTAERPGFDCGPIGTGATGCSSPPSPGRRNPPSTIGLVGRLAASILSADLAPLAEQVKLVEQHAEVIHIDIMDGHFVPPIALGTVVVDSLRPYTQRTLHGHLMVDAPEQFFEELADAGLDVVSFHHEAVGDPEPAIAKARAAGLRVGLTLNMETSVEAVFPVARSGGRRDADEHPAGVERANAGIPRSTLGWRRSGAEIDRQGLPSTWRSTAASRSTTPGLPSTRAPRS